MGIIESMASPLNVLLVIGFIIAVNLVLLFNKIIKFLFNKIFSKKAKTNTTQGMDPLFTPSVSTSERLPQTSFIDAVQNPSLEHTHMSERRIIQ